VKRSIEQLAGGKKSQPRATPPVKSANSCAKVMNSAADHPGQHRKAAGRNDSVKPRSILFSRISGVFMDTGKAGKPFFPVVRK
jgi:hypothetical protein